MRARVCASVGAKVGVRERVGVSVRARMRGIWRHEEIFEIKAAGV